MKISLDTNVLLRLVVGDDPAQEKIAVEALENAEQVAVSLQALCEFTWVLGRRYGASRQHIAAAIRHLLDRQNIAVNRPAVEAGLSLLLAGGDFADGVIAFEGQWLGGEVFISFDKKAVRLLTRQGKAAELLS